MPISFYSVPTNKQSFVPKSSLSWLHRICTCAPTLRTIPFIFGSLLVIQSTCKLMHSGQLTLKTRLLLFAFTRMHYLTLEPGVVHTFWLHLKSMYFSKLRKTIFRGVFKQIALRNCPSGPQRDMKLLMGIQPRRVSNGSLEQWNWKCILFFELDIRGQRVR